MSTKPTSDRGASPRDPGPRPPAVSGPGQPVAETPDLNGAYPRLSDAQIAALSSLGQRRPARPDEILFAEGDRNCDFFVVLAGQVAIGGSPRDTGGARHQRARPGPLPRRAQPADRARRPTTRPCRSSRARCSRCPPASSANSSPTIQRFGDLILRACLHPALASSSGSAPACGSSAPVTRRTPAGCGTSRPATGFRHRWLDLEADPAAEALLAAARRVAAKTPRSCCWARRVLRNPSNAELAAAIGLPAPAPPGARCDLLVIGGGPGRAGRGGIRRVRGADDHPDRQDGLRRPGRYVVADRELPRLPGRPLRASKSTARAALQAQKFGVRNAPGRHGDLADQRERPASSRSISTRVSG